MVASFFAIFIDRALRQLRHATPEFAGMKAGQRALDVCCGTGDQAVHYARLGLDTWGIDLDPKMIAIAEAGRKRYSKANLHFQIADAVALPFEDGFFDHATVSLALHEKPFKLQQKVIAEMRRVVKKDGTLVLADFPVPAGRFIRFIEGLVGGEHYVNFKAYQANGGLEYLTELLRLDIEKRGAVMGGAVRLFKIRN